MLASIKLITFLTIFTLSEASLRPHVARQLDSHGRWRRGGIQQKGGKGTTKSSQPATATAVATGNGNDDPNTSLTLLASLVQSNNAFTGLEPGQNGSTTAGIDAVSTSINNYINFCASSSKPPSNGLQISTGSCMVAPIGDLPDISNAGSIKFNSPKNGDTIPSNTNFTVTLNVKNLVLGRFGNPDMRYMMEPCGLDPATGFQLGHTHYIAQKVASLADTTPLNTKQPDFFVGMKGNLDANGQVSVLVTGLSAGIYRMGTLTSCNTHQVMNLPVATRGLIEDVVYVTVADGATASSGNNANTGTGASTGTGTGANGSGAQGGGKGVAATTTTVAAVKTTTTTTIAKTTSGAQGNAGGKTGNTGSKGNNGGFPFGQGQGKGGQQGNGQQGKGGNTAVVVKSPRTVTVTSTNSDCVETAHH